MAARRMAEDVKKGPLRLGDRFLKYEIQELIGRGGYAWVYHGRDEFLDVDVAIKVLHRAGGVTSDMLRRGRAEAKLLYRLKHPNIVEVLDAGITDEGLLYIVMELLRGRTHRELIRTRRLAVAETLELFAGIADGVEAAHRVGAIHRDLKPENVFVLDDNKPKVLDFGIAKVVDSAGFTTEKDVVHGTMLYLAPERLHGHAATVRSDVYALGVMLFETLCGRHPCLLKNTSPTVRELAWIQSNVIPPPLDELDPTIPKYIARAVDRAMTKQPDERMLSMQDFGTAIRACMARLAEELQTDRLSLSPVSVTPSPRPNQTVRMPHSRASASESPDAQPHERSVGSTDPMNAPAAPISPPGTVPPTTTSVQRRDHARLMPRDSRARRRTLVYVAVLGAVAVGAFSVYATTSDKATVASPSLPSASASALALASPSSLALPSTKTRNVSPPPPKIEHGDGLAAKLPPQPAVSATARRAPAARATVRQNVTREEAVFDEPLVPPDRKVWAE